MQEISRFPEETRSLLNIKIKKIKEIYINLSILYQKIKNSDIKVVGIGDHGISIGVYILDPDGNQVEIFYELPKSEWPNIDIFTGSFPGSLDPNIR